MVRLCYCETYCLFIMLRRPPRSTRTYTRCPCTTLCRSRRTRRGILCRGATTEWQRSDKERHAEREGQQSLHRRCGAGRRCGTRRPLWGPRGASSRLDRRPLRGDFRRPAADGGRSEEHTSELQSPMRPSYAVFCLKKKTQETNNT